jgi:ribosome-binding factor A
MSKPTFKRSERVSDQMKREIADILMRKIKDPRIGFVTVTDVEVADDLRNAKVFVSVYGGDEEKKASLQGLKSAAPFIRSELGKRMRMRFIPELLFRFDATVERGAHIMELLHSIEEQNDKKDPADE